MSTIAIRPLFESFLNEIRKFSKKGPKVGRKYSFLPTPSFYFFPPFFYFTGKYLNQTARRAPNFPENYIKNRVNWEYFLWSNCPEFKYRPDMIYSLGGKNFLFTSMGAFIFKIFFCARRRRKVFIVAPSFKGGEYRESNILGSQPLSFLFSFISFPFFFLAGGGGSSGWGL